MKLGKFQQELSEYIFSNSNSHKKMSLLKPYNDEETEARLAIYKNNVFHSLIDVLEDLYPTLVITVGEEFFRAMAKTYLTQHPPKSAAMVEFGKDFPQFIQSFPPALEYGYFPSLATFDLLQHEAYHAKDCPPVSADFFVNVDMAALPAMSVIPLPSLRLFSSEYAVYSIWQFSLNEPQDDENINSDMPEAVLVIRPSMKVETHLIGQDVFSFLSALYNGVTIGEALENTMDIHTDFDASQAIQFLIQSGFCAQVC